MTLATFFTSSKDGKFGTCVGVLIPNILQMIGVILFMRLGWILGHVGGLQMGIIASISSTLLFLTSLSMTAIVSNMKMRGGGSYYIISRSLGIELGSAIGVLQCAAQFCSIALCTTGFCLSLGELFPNTSVVMLKMITLTTLFCISYISTNLAMKTQMFIFIILCIAISAIFWGYSGIPTQLPPLSVTSSLGFWAAFAMFFPATTGIESGMAMSGDLKNPSRSLPIGTLASVIVVFFLYFSIILFLARNVPAAYLRDYPFLLFYTNKYGLLILFGVWAASLSSALGSILGSPRVIQAIARDGVLPQFLAKGFGPTQQPRTATFFVYILSMILLLSIEINQIIPILTMICLVTYGLINFIAFFESFLKNPSWRPTMPIHWAISLTGSLGCFLAMLLINSAATFIVISLVTLLCFWTSSRKIGSNLNDIRYSLYSYFVQKGTVHLSRFEEGAKNWRPYILALFNKGELQKNLAFFAHALNQDKGFLTFGVCQKTDGSLQEHLKAFNIPSYLHVNTLANPTLAADQIIKNYGFGHLKPNTILFSIPTPFEPKEFVNLLLDTHAQKKNIVLLKDESQMDYIYSDPQKIHKKINLWWRGQNRGNFELCLALAYLLQQSKLWKKSTISLNMIAKDETVQRDLLEQYETYRPRLRIKDFTFAPIIDAHEDFVSHLNDQKADLTLLGLKTPTPETTLEEYTEYYFNLMQETASIKNIAYVLAGEEMMFRKIFL